MADGLEIDLTRGRIVVLIGKQASGKSFLLRSIMYQLAKQKRFTFGRVFTSTGFNGDYDWLEPHNVESNYSEERLEEYIDKLRGWLKRNPGKKLPPNFIILDDLLGKMHINSGTFNNLMATYRHFNTSIFITSQYMVKNVSSLLRELTDIAFIFKTRFKNTRVALYEAFGQMLESQKEFNELLESATEEKHSCLVYYADKDDPADAYFAFKAPPNDPPFLLKF